VKLAMATPVSNKTVPTAPDIRGRTSSSYDTLGRGTPLCNDAAPPPIWTELGSMLAEDSISHGTQAEWTGVTSISTANTGSSTASTASTGSSTANTGSTSTRCSCGCDSNEESQTSELETTTHSQGVVSPLNEITNKWTNVVPGEPTAKPKNGVMRAAPPDDTEKS